MRQLFVATLLLLSVCLFGQEEAISLPDSDLEQRTVSTPYYPIMVTRNRDIILFRDTLSVSELPKKIFQGVPGYFNYYVFPNAQAHLLVDKTVPYSLVDSIKTQIASTPISQSYFYYRTSFENEITSRVRALKNKNHMSFFKLAAPEFLLTDKDLEKRDSIRELNKQSGFPIPPAPLFLNTITSTEKAIYSIQQDAIDQVLNNKDCVCLFLKPDGLYAQNKKMVDINDSERLFELYVAQDIVLIKFDELLSYQDYFNYLTTLDAVLDELKSKKQTEIIELSSEILKIHNEKKIILSYCN